MQIFNNYVFQSMCNSRKAILKKALPIALLIGGGATATLNAQNQTDKVSTEQTIVNNGADKNLLSNTYTIDSLTSDTLTKTSAKQSEAMTAAQTNTEQNKYKTSPLGLLTMALGAIFTTGMGALLFSKSSKNIETKEAETPKAGTDNNQAKEETTNVMKTDEGDNTKLTHNNSNLYNLMNIIEALRKSHPEYNFRINENTLSIEVVKDENYKKEQQKRIDAFCKLLKDNGFNYTIDENYNININYDHNRIQYNNLQNYIFPSEQAGMRTLLNTRSVSYEPNSYFHFFSYAINGVYIDPVSSLCTWEDKEGKYLQMQDTCNALTELEIPHVINKNTGMIEIEGKYINQRTLNNFGEIILRYSHTSPGTDWVPHDKKLLDFVNFISGDIGPMSIPKECKISQNNDGSGTITTPLGNVVRVEHILDENDNGSAPYDNLVNTIKNLNINLSEAQIKQAFEKGINRSDVLKFYNLFSDEDKKVKGELANTFIKEWILDGVTYDDLDKFLKLPYCQDFADSGEASVFTTDDRKRYAKGVNAQLLTNNFNIKDMIYLSESKNLNLQYIYVIMALINTKQIKLDDIKNMDEDSLREFCNQFDKSRGSDLWQLEECLFRSCPEDINWEKILSDKKYNEEHSISSMPIREIVSENPAFAGDPEMQKFINALLG